MWCTSQAVVTPLFWEGSEQGQGKQCVRVSTKRRGLKQNPSCTMKYPEKTIHCSQICKQEILQLSPKPLLFQFFPSHMYLEMLFANT